MAKAKPNKQVESRTQAGSTEPQPGNSEAAREPSKWTFFTNHAHVLVLLYRDPDLVLREIAAQVGITERAVQRIVHDLEEEGFIEREKVGRRNSYQVLRNKYLRHPIESHCKIDDLIDFILKSG